MTLNIWWVFFIKCSFQYQLLSVLFLSSMFATFKYLQCSLINIFFSSFWQTHIPISCLSWGIFLIFLVDKWVEHEASGRTKCDGNFQLENLHTKCKNPTCFGLLFTRRQALIFFFFTWAPIFSRNFSIVSHYSVCFPGLHDVSIYIQAPFQIRTKAKYILTCSYVQAAGSHFAVDTEQRKYQETKKKICCLKQPVAKSNPLTHRRLQFSSDLKFTGFSKLSVSWTFIFWVYITFVLFPFQPLLFFFLRGVKNRNYEMVSGTFVSFINHLNSIVAVRYGFGVREWAIWRVWGTLRLLLETFMNASTRGSYYITTNALLCPDLSARSSLYYTVYHIYFNAIQLLLRL